MKRTLMSLAILSALSGCSLLSPTINAAEETAATAVVNSSERVICRDIPVGTWTRMYGSSAERVTAWRSLCAATTATPTP